MTKTIFFGSSMNPPTKAHRALVEYLLEKYTDAKIVIAPVYDHVFSKLEMAPFKDRLEIAQIAFEDLIKNKRVVVSDIEEKASRYHDKKVGTAIVLEHFISEYNLQENLPEMVLGADTYEDFFGGKWIAVEDILKQVSKIHVFEREGISLPTPQSVVDTARKQCEQMDEELAKERITNKELAKSQSKQEAADAEQKLLDAIEANNHRKQKLDIIQTVINAGEEDKLIIHSKVIKDTTIQKASSTKARTSHAHSKEYLQPAVHEQVESRKLYIQLRDDLKFKEENKHQSGHMELLPKNTLKRKDRLMPHAEHPETNVKHRGNRSHESTKHKSR